MFQCLICFFGCIAGLGLDKSNPYTSHQEGAPPCGCPKGSDSMHVCNASHSRSLQKDCAVNNGPTYINIRKGRASLSQKESFEKSHIDMCFFRIHIEP